MAGVEPRGADARAAAREVTAWRVLAIAGPIVVSNATVPLQGAVDTAIIGRLGELTPLAAVGLGAEVFSLLFGVFNFLQIGVSGLSAQALGAHAHDRLAYVLLRGLMIGGAIGVTLFVLQAPLAWLLFGIFEASAETEALAATYFTWRMFGAPAELMNYGLVGWFAGQEQVRRLFKHQVVLAALNIGLNVLLVTVFDLGVFGVAIGTAIASWLGFLYGLTLARSRASAFLPLGWRPARERLLDPAALSRLFSLNRDIFIRTLLLIGAFTWTMRLGTLLGDEILAVNVVLWQFFIVSAYAMDGFAIAAETLVGQAMGARDRALFDRSARLVMIWGGVLACVLSLVFYLAGPAIIDLFTTEPGVRATARDYVFWAAFIPLLGVWAFMLDGIFVGATASSEMRNGMIAASAVFAPLSWIMMTAAGNHGIWAAVWIWLLLRAGALLLYMPRLRARAAGAQAFHGD